MKKAERVFEELLNLVSEQTEAMQTMTSKAATRRFECLDWLLDIAKASPEGIAYKAAQRARIRKEIREHYLNALSGGMTQTENNAG
jgi:hypothetical protein